MYECYWRQNNTLNWLIGANIFLGALSNMMSQRQCYNPLYSMPIFTFPMYNTPYFYTPTYTVETYTPSYTPPRNPDYLRVGNLLENVLTTTTPSTYPTQSSIPAITNLQNTKQDNINLVGNALNSIIDSQISATSETNIQNIKPLAEKKTKKTKKTIIPRRIATVTVPKTNGDSNIQRTANSVHPSPDIINKVKQISQRINCDYKDLLGLIFCESSFKTVPDNWNGKSAVGLIQFTDINLKDLNQIYGTNLTKNQIAKMPALEQLDWVEKSLLRAKQVAGFSNSHRLTASELYAINYAPANARRQDYVSKKGDGLYEGNEGLDLNKDGKITHSELAQKIQKGTLNVVC